MKENGGGRDRLREEQERDGAGGHTERRMGTVGGVLSFVE
jgi:hypothetical protein